VKYPSFIDIPTFHHFSGLQSQYIPILAGEMPLFPSFPPENPPRWGRSLLVLLLFGPLPVVPVLLHGQQGGLNRLHGIGGLRRCHSMVSGWVLDGDFTKNSGSTMVNEQ
jgi:hypothetical protein